MPKQGSHFVCLLLKVIDSVCKMTIAISYLYFSKKANTQKKKETSDASLKKKKWKFLNIAPKKKIPIKILNNLE